jgi:NADPH-dependent 2,4-dienoyl-CoA reductase/sulfur reductase-like enzyme
MKRIAIIGAGPIGLEAALRAVMDGHDVNVYERRRIGASLMDWGHVKLFSPWAMNVSPLGLDVIGHRGVPADDDLVTGRQMVEAYLEPLGRSSQLVGRIHEGVTVAHVGRDGLAKNDFIGSRRRGKAPFRLLISDASGRESVAEADIVIDASGVWGNPNYCGNGNIPAPGERLHRDRLIYGMPDFDDPTVVARHAGLRTMIVGAGHSAATSICGLAALMQRMPGTELVWVTRSDRAFVPLDDDPLPYRAEVLRRANDVLSRNAGARHRPKSTVDSIFSGRSRPLRVTLRSEGSTLVEEVDVIVSNCGFSPDNALYRELQVHECWATRGPMKLSAILVGETGADCLAQTTRAAETLTHPEPGFFIIGNKSYGKLANFLLRIGREQVEQVLGLIEASTAVSTAR